MDVYSSEGYGSNRLWKADNNDPGAGGAGTAARSVSRKYTPETFADDSNQLFILQLQATSSRDVFWGKSEATLTIIKKFKLGLKLIETNSKLIDCESKSPTSLK